jgi:hypothetical protein
MLQSAPLAPALSDEKRAASHRPLERPSVPLESAPRPPAPIPAGLVAPGGEITAHNAAHHRRTLAVPMPRRRPAQLARTPSVPTRALSLIPD